MLHPRVSMFCLIWLIFTITTFAIEFTPSPKQVLAILEKRASSCTNTTYTQCSDSNLPSNFCCAPKSTCITLDNASSALCCPSGADCTNIQPIPCDVSQQNVALHPETSVMTTKLNGTLATCGASSCCPFGYNCVKDLCVINKSSSSLGTAVSGGSSASSSSTGTLGTTDPPASSVTSSAASSTSSISAAASAIDSNLPPEPHCNRFPAAAVVAGFFPGFILGALGAVAVVILMGKHSFPRPTSSSTDQSIQKFGHFRGRSADGEIIGVSGPVPQAEAARTDFLRRSPGIQSPTGQSVTGRVKSWFQPNAKNRASSIYSRQSRYPFSPNDYDMPDLPTNINPNFTQGSIPPTEPLYVRRGVPRDSTTESIKIYSPPSILNRSTNLPTSPPPVAMTAIQRLKMATNYGSSGAAASFPYAPPPIPSDDLSPPGNNKRSRPTTTFTEIMQRSGFEEGRP